MDERLRENIWFRRFAKNLYSIAALMPLVDAHLAEGPQPGIMLYSLASAQAEEIYREANSVETFENAQRAGRPADESCKPDDLRVRAVQLAEVSVSVEPKGYQ